ncbi:DUF3011 domain-containing protein [Sphingomonas sp. DT-204]|uniref:DUF3011 domain-containing protein n=1 Tax=Sphingomonas sp. DT-204 TaxID=3396166 RepID=UPI003F1C70D2
MQPTNRGIGLGVFGLILASGSPERLSLAPTSAAAATKLVCSSVNYDYSYCPIDTRNGVRLLQTLSRSPCIEGRTWGKDPRGIWVDRGCSAQFSVSSGGGDAGSVIGAAIIGGIVGALLGGSSHGDGDSGHHHHHHDNPSPPPYDRYGNANYDRKGRYVGCHGLGCTVDNPDDHSQDVDTTPQFDKDGNPNFDTHGNYIGAHGLGSLVDNPDAPSSDGSNPNQ